jgi:hypothetical protein
MGVSPFDGEKKRSVASRFAGRPEPRQKPTVNSTARLQELAAGAL